MGRTNDTDPDEASVRRAYRRYAPVYDLIFGPPMMVGRMRSVEIINGLPGKRVLEVGVGTGLSLRRYRKDIQVTGIDLSTEMLAVAKRRVERLGLPNVEALLEMDAQNLDFPDESFDVVVAMYVMSVVPDPQKVAAEMRRVCKPSGMVLVCNHFTAENPVRRGFERMLSPLSRWLGWRPDFPRGQLLSGTDLEVVRTHPVPPFNLFNVLECRRPA